MTAIKLPKQESNKNEFVLTKQEIVSVTLTGALAISGMTPANVFDRREKRLLVE